MKDERVWGVIRTGDACRYYTFFKEIFETMGDFQNEYNWLITDIDGYPANDTRYESFYEEHSYLWLSGKELSDNVYKHDYQWNWAVLSGFEKSVELDEILKEPLPYADGYTGFWKPDLSIQHPLAKVEMVAWDSGATLLFAKEYSLYSGFMDNISGVVDLSEYNSDGYDEKRYYRMLEKNNH